MMCWRGTCRCERDEGLRIASLASRSAEAPLDDVSHDRRVVMRLVARAVDERDRASPREVDQVL
jgi:hypothetical protein